MTNMRPKNRRPALPGPILAMVLAMILAMPLFMFPATTPALAAGTSADSDTTTSGARAAGNRSARQITNPLQDMTATSRATADTLERATVWVLVYDGDGDLESTGSGFLIGENLIMTNGHVAWSDSARRPAERIVVLNKHLPPTEAKVVAIDYDRRYGAGLGASDFAVLRFTHPRGVELPHLAFNLEARRMDLIGAWGYPGVILDFDPRYRDLRDGRLAEAQAPEVVFTGGAINTFVDSENRKVIMHSASISSGNSGGPLVNVLGEVVGINTSRYAPAEGDLGREYSGFGGLPRRRELVVLHFSLSSADIVRFLVENDIEHRLASGQTMASLDGGRSGGGRSGGGRSGGGQSGGDGTDRDKPDDPPQTAKRQGRTKLLTSFKIDVPEDWSVMLEEDDSIILCSDDLEAMVGVVVQDNDGQSLAAVAKLYSRELGGSTPVADEESWVFNIEDDELPTLVAVSKLDNDNHVMVFMGGDYNHAGVADVLDSLDEW